MVLYPANLNIQGRACVIIGGGRVAARKAAALLECGVRLTVVSPVLDPDFTELEAGLEHLGRAYQEGDLDGALLGISANDNAAGNRAVECGARGRHQWPQGGALPQG